MTEQKHWTITLEEDPATGELIMPFPPDMLAQVGWDFGDTLIWEDMQNGSWTLKKKENAMSMSLDVLLFQNACDQKPSVENASLYHNLMVEEYSEFIAAQNARDEVEQLDACMDLIWVTLGFCHMKGFDVAGAWDEVLKTNMAKVDPVTGKVRRREDGKILKPEGWKPPDLSKFVRKT